MPVMRSLVAVAAAAALALAAGCGGSDSGDGGTGTGTGGAPDGGQVFASAGCASCHTLADAGASGTAGPNLDERKPSKEQVAAKVRNGGGGMPSFKGRLSDEEIDAVAAYVAEVAGR